MFEDFKELLSAFNAHRVKYLIVGKAVFAALAQFGTPLEGLRSEDFAEPGSFFRLGRPPIMVDILPSISGVDFDVAWERRVDAAIDDTLTVPFISREDLLAAKVAAGRSQDLADAAALRDAHDTEGGAPPKQSPSR